MPHAPRAATPDPCPRRRPTLSRMPALASMVLCLAAGIHVRADGPADNRADAVRPVPPPGIEIPATERARLEASIRDLSAAIDAARPRLAASQLDRLPDVLIFLKAVDWALRGAEIHQTNEIATAQRHLDEGHKRLLELLGGRTPWLQQPGPVALGYRSRIDDSIQPYGLVIPDGTTPGDTQPRRLDVWFHGRGEKLSELAFIAERSSRRGEFAPAGAFVLHPYGRYCNGSRFAGETDAWEALDNVRSRFAIDPDRLVVRGFSLGGASCWHFAVHHASRWAAAAPGAGFSETAEFLKVFQNETLQPTWWEQKLWRLHDATAHALNTSMVPLVAYSGEKDGQIQAARAMERAMAAENLELLHILGTNAGHQYTPLAKTEIDRRIDAAARLGRDPLPRSVRFITHTLRYPRMAWVTLDGLEHHWNPARVEALMDPAAGRISATLTNVTALTLEIPPGLSPFDPRSPVTVVLDGQSFAGPRPRSDRSWTASFHRTDNRWNAGPPSAVEKGSSRKRHGLQGPIDDAFMDSFLFVRPTGEAANPEAARWTARELTRAIEQWRRHYRGDVRIKDDTALTDADRAAHHLVLWGDPTSNAELARILDRLPIRWTRTTLELSGKAYPADHHMAVLVQPNPAQPDRYVVLNSGFTFREYDYLNNARQTPKLPDWAVLDVSTPPDARRPGAIVDAGFFGEDWQWLPGGGR